MSGLHDVPPTRAHSDSSRYTYLHICTCRVWIEVKLLLLPRSAGHEGKQDTIPRSEKYSRPLRPPELSLFLWLDVQCQACFLSHKVSSGQEDGEVRHLPSHDVTRIMGKTAVPDRALRS